MLVNLRDILTLGLSPGNWVSMAHRSNLHLPTSKGRWLNLNDQCWNHAGLGYNGSISKCWAKVLKIKRRSHLIVISKLAFLNIPHRGLYFWSDGTTETINATLQRYFFNFIENFASLFHDLLRRKTPVSQLWAQTLTDSTEHPSSHLTLRATWDNLTLPPHLISSFLST